MKKIVFLTGAGISAESGISTFRYANGLWEGHDIMAVASYDGFLKNPELVLDFYNIRRRQLLTVKPNLAHQLITNLQEKYEVRIITQNVDDLHERAGNSNVIHLHGELLKSRSVVNENLVYECFEDILITSKNNLGHQLRPHIVWFGEAVPEMENAIIHIEKADIIVIVGTSLQVYPAAGLIDFARNNALIFYIDQNPAETKHYNKDINVIAKKATEGMLELYEL